MAGPRDCAGHPGRTNRRLQPNYYYGDQDHRPILFSQQDGIRRGVLAGNYDGGWQHAGGSGNGRPVPIPGLEYRVDALTWEEHGEIRGCYLKMDPAHWCITNSLHR